MDKNWMLAKNRLGAVFIKGIGQFMECTEKVVAVDGKVRCPCKNCKNVYRETLATLENHLFDNGIDPSYTRLVHHGERFGLHEPQVQNEAFVDRDWGGAGQTSDMEQMLEDVEAGMFGTASVEGDADSDIHGFASMHGKKFARLWADLEEDLFPGCKEFSRLSFIVEMMHAKKETNMSVRAFNWILGLFRRAIGDTEGKLPKSHDDCKKLRDGLGFSYDKIHACVNDYVLFWKENKDKDKCPVWCKQISI